MEFLEEIYEEIVELNEAQQVQLENLIKRKVIDQGIELKPTLLTSHKIDVQGHEPIKQTYYYVSPKIREFMYEKVDSLLEEKIREPSNADSLNPIVMIKIPYGKYIFCLDFRKVNNHMTKNGQTNTKINTNGIMV